MIAQQAKWSIAGVAAIATVVALEVPIAGYAAPAMPSHNPISIQSDSDFQHCGCVSSGTGSLSDPYVIGPLAITVTTGPGVLINGAHLTKSFVLSNLRVGGDSTKSSSGIELENINSATPMSATVSGVQTSISHTGTGILISSSTGVTLDGGGANPAGPGIKASGAGTINHNAVGAVDVEDSSGVTVRGWQFSANGPPGNPDWIGFDPSLDRWGVGAVRLFGSTDSVVDHNSANNDTVVSYSLFDSSSDSVTWNTADYPFTSNVMVTDGSSDDTVADNVFGTADFIGVLVADPLPGKAVQTSYASTHDIVVEGNQDHSDGATGTEIKTGVTPAFLGGIVLLNGTYDNTVEDNQANSNSGGDLVWAQVVPQPSSPIGVITYPPTLHCNVSASEGGGGVGNLNGNQWVGNTVRKADPCIPAQ